MKKIMLLLGFLVTTAALAGDAVIWNGSYGKFLPQLGLKLSDSKEYRTISVNPSAGLGVPAQIGSVAVRDNAGVGEAWFKASALDTAWTNILTGLTGWTLTGNTGTDDTLNFLGTTDLQDLVVKTNNTSRMTIKDNGRFEYYPDGDGTYTFGTVGPVTGNYNQHYMAQQFGTISADYIGVGVAPNFTDVVTGGISNIGSYGTFQSGSSASYWQGLNISPSFLAGSTIGNITGINNSSTIAAGTATSAYINGVYSSPNIQSNFLGYSGFTSQPSITGAMTNGYNGFSENAQFGAASSMPSNYKAFQAQPVVASGATFTSGTGYFSGAQIASSVTINDWTDFQASTDIDSAIANYNGIQINPQGAGVATNANLLSLSPNMSGDNVSVVGLNFGGTIGDDITNYVGIQISPNATGTVTNVSGINVDNSSLNSTIPKTGISTQEGSAIIQAQYSTAEYGGGIGFGFMNQIGGTFTVDAGSPVTGGGSVIANNLATVQQFDDNMPVDLTGGLIGYTYVGFVSQTNVAAGVTVDHINAALAGSGVSPTSTGGAVTTADMYAAAGFLNQGGTIDITGEMRGLHLTSNLCSFVSGQCFGIKDDVGARNYFLGGVELATSGAQPACSATIRGTLWIVQGGAGVADQYQVCKKDAANAYAWQQVSSGNWSLAGNALTVPGTDFIGTTDLQDFVVKTNNIEAVRVLSTGEVIAEEDIKSKTSITVEDPGAGTNTVTVQAGVVSASYAVTLPLAQATAAQQVIVNDGTGVTAWQSLTPQLFGTRTTGRTIVAGTGITAAASHMSTTVASQLIFVVGSSGGTDITASPQIEAGTIVGQEMEICGTVDADWVQLDNGTGLSLNGPAVLGKDDCITLRWLGSDGTTSDWAEKSRNF